jgi:hypothetical protein
MLQIMEFCLLGIKVPISLLMATAFHCLNSGFSQGYLFYADLIWGKGCLGYFYS